MAAKSADQNRKGDRSPHYISSIREIEALRSPVRFRILDAMISLGPSTVRQIAERLDLVPESVYYHIKALARIGLIRDLGKRPAKRRPESVYEAVAAEIRIDTTKRTPRFRRALADFYESALRIATRGLRKALDEDRAVRDGSERNFCTYQVEARLSPERLREWNRRIEELCTFMLESDEEGETIHMTISAHPMD